MSTRIETGILIVGSGPAGSSAALFLERVRRGKYRAGQVLLDREHAAGPVGKGERRS